VSTQPGIFLEGKGGRGVGVTTLPTSCADCQQSGIFNFLEPLGPIQVLIYFSCVNKYRIFIVQYSTVEFITFLLHLQFVHFIPELPQPKLLIVTRYKTKTIIDKSVE
jgi:hypothetical protein